MATEPLIVWNAPEHIHLEKKTDWFWSVSFITLALAIVALIFGQVLTAVFIVVAAIALMIHAAHPPRTLRYEINDRGIMAHDILYPFLNLESFWIPHDHFPPKIILKSRKLFVPYIIIYIDEVDPESVREVLLTYIAETEHHEPMLKHLLTLLGF